MHLCLIVVVFLLKSKFILTNVALTILVCFTFSLFIFIIFVDHLSLAAVTLLYAAEPTR